MIHYVKFIFKDDSVLYYQLEVNNDTLYYRLMEFGGIIHIRKDDENISFNTGIETVLNLDYDAIYSNIAEYRIDRFLKKEKVELIRVKKEDWKRG